MRTSQDRASPGSRPLVHTVGACVRHANRSATSLRSPPHPAAAAGGFGAPALAGARCSGCNPRERPGVSSAGCDQSWSSKESWWSWMRVALVALFEISYVLSWPGGQEPNASNKIIEVQRGMPGACRESASNMRESMQLRAYLAGYCLALGCRMTTVLKQRPRRSTARMVRASYPPPTTATILSRSATAAYRQDSKRGREMTKAREGAGRRRNALRRRRVSLWTYRTLGSTMKHCAG